MALLNRARTSAWPAACLLFLLAVLLPETSHSEPEARESDLKATFLFNFSQFVTWPASAFEDPESPFVIGILGANPFGKFLDDLVQNERAQGKHMMVQRFTNDEEANRAHILFVARSEQARVESILNRLRHRPVLTVADFPDRSFIRRGGMVDLVTDKQRLRIRINLEATQTAGLTVSSKLLRIAEVVRPREP